jgi:hypothetical protein
MNVALWCVQGLLALAFLAAGGMKLAMPVEDLAAQMPLPGRFIQFIGLAEVLGALGLVLPGLLRIRTGLAPLAAAGLAIIMVGAVVRRRHAGHDGRRARADPARAGAARDVRRLRPPAPGAAAGGVPPVRAPGGRLSWRR